jgi:hypothetical protein
VTSLTDCTVTLAWDPVNFTSADFNYHCIERHRAVPTTARAPADR